MRGRIIHYNSNEGRGLISADGKQYPFEIGQWQSEVAPTLNAQVDFDIDGERPVTVRRVGDDELMREKAAEFGGKLSALGGAALKGAQDAAAHANVGNPVEHLGRRTLITQAVFAFGALFLSYIKIGGFGYTLAGLSQMSEQMGMSMGSGAVVWLAILSLLVPLFWRNRFAWFALLLPLIATLKPMWDIYSAIGNASVQVGMGAEFSRRIAQQMADMFDFGLGAWVCVIAALILAVIGIMRFLVTPAN